MKKQRFTTTLMPPKARWARGYASSGIIDPGQWADDLYGKTIPGPWLTCYMLRRFGWPNLGSDDYKDLCVWSLTTPLEGLYLVVRPHLTDGGPLGKPFCGKTHGNLHFSVLFTKEVGEQMDLDPEFERYAARLEKAVRRWWERKGMHLYVFTEGDPEEDALVHKWSTEEGKTLGLWKRPSGFRKQRLAKRIDYMFLWWMAEFLRERHPGVVPETKSKGKRKPTPFQRSVRKAIEATLRDLLRPTYVRDLNFNPFGHTESCWTTTSREDVRALVAEPFEGAGRTPEYWYSARRKRHEKGKAA